MKKFAEIRTERPFFTLVLLILFGLLLLSVILAVNMGTMDISPSEIFQVVLFRLFGIGDPALYGSGPISDVIWYIRLPRIVLAIAVGMGLSVCGVVMQAVVKNPLADPYILGISSGASLGATMAIMLGIGAFLGSNFVGIAAFAGAFLISLGVMTLANIGGRSNSTKLLLAGMALSAICSAFSNFIVYFANDKNGIQTVTYWLMGSLAGAEWGGIAVVFPIVAIAAVFFWSQARRLNLMLLGDEASITLGTNLHKWRHIYLLVTSVIIGFVVYSSGMIGFVGLVIPHTVRMIFGTDHRRLVPLCALVGAIYLIWADVLCRIIIPKTELPIGILTSMIGAPCFIYLMVRKRYGFGGGD